VNKSVSLVALPACLLLASCESTLLYQKEIPEFKPPSDKALMVIIRSESMDGVTIPQDQKARYTNDNSDESLIYVDGKYVSGNRSDCITSFPVPAGKHLIMAKIAGTSKIMFDFKPGKSYFVYQATFQYPTPFAMVVTSGMYPMHIDSAMAKIRREEANWEYVYPNQKNLEKDLDEDDYQSELKEYQQWMAERPSDFKGELEYPGY